MVSRRTPQSNFSSLLMSSNVEQRYGVKGMPGRYHRLGMYISTDARDCVLLVDINGQLRSSMSWEPLSLGLA